MKWWGFRKKKLLTFRVTTVFFKLNITFIFLGSDSSFSSQKPNGRQCDKRKSSKAACGKKKNKENNNNNTTPSLATDHAAANNHIENRPSTSDSDEP